MTNHQDPWTVLARRAENLTKVKDLPNVPIPVFAKRKNDAVPLIAMVGSGNSGKSSCINALLGTAVSAVADRDESSHPIFIGYGAESYQYRMQDGREVDVERDTFLDRLRFNVDGRRDETIANGIVRLPLGQLQICEFVDLPGLGGRWGGSLDSVTMQIATQCPMAITTFSRLGADALGVIGKLASAGVASVCLRTKSDLELRSDTPETLRDVQFQELSDMLERDLIAPNFLITIKSEWAGQFGVLDAAVIGKQLASVAKYYVIGKACAKIRGDVGRLLDASSSVHVHDEDTVTQDVRDRENVIAMLNTLPRNTRYTRGRLLAQITESIGGSRRYRLTNEYGPLGLPETATAAQACSAVSSWITEARWQGTHKEWVARTLGTLERTYLPIARDLHREAAALLALNLEDEVQACWFARSIEGKPLLPESLFCLGDSH